MATDRISQTFLFPNRSAVITTLTQSLQSNWLFISFNLFIIYSKLRKVITKEISCSLFITNIIIKLYTHLRTNTDEIREFFPLHQCFFSLLICTRIKCYIRISIQYNVLFMLKISLLKFDDHSFQCVIVQLKKWRFFVFKMYSPLETPSQFWINYCFYFVRHTNIFYNRKLFKRYLYIENKYTSS